MLNPKYYAVIKGKKPGIYSNWETCKEMVNGYQGAIYKSFYNQADAKNYLKANLIPNQNITNTIYCAYVDGSYDKKNPNICGAGAVILKQNKIIKKISKKFANDFCGNNVIGEIYSVLAVLQYCQSYKIKNIAIYHDYQGLSAWIDQTWKTTKSISQFYYEQYHKIVDSSRIIVIFNKIKSHSNNQYNDLADQLAKQAINH